jgi:hypothetical protein
MTAPESPRADVELSEAREMLAEAMADRVTWGDGTEYINVEDAARILADRLAAVQAEAEIAGQMKHITAEMVRGNQPLEAKEEMIADLRARLSHVEAERDGWQARAATNREGWAQMLARAESAEAERDDLRARLLAVETLADRWAPCCEGTPFMAGDILADLRAVLASPSTHTQPSSHTRAQTDCGPDFCEECSSAAGDWVQWPCFARRECHCTGEGGKGVCPHCGDWHEDDLSCCPHADRLRAVLASPSTHTQRDTETAAQAWYEGWEARAEYSTRREVPTNWPDLNPYRADSLDTGAGS